MVHTLHAFLRRIVYDSFFILLITPLSYLLIGTLYAGHFTSIQFPKFLLLYCFVFLNQFLEHFTAQIGKHKKKGKEFFLGLIAIELLNIAILVYFTLSVHLLMGVLSLLYSFVLHTYVYLDNVNLQWASLLIRSFFRGGILTYLSFFIHLNFVPSSLFYWSVPLMITVLFTLFGQQSLESENKEDQAQKNISLLKYFLLLLLAAVYVSSILILTDPFGQLVWFFLLTIPPAWNCIKPYRSEKKDFQRRTRNKNLLLFSIAYQCSFSLILILYFFF